MEDTNRRGGGSRLSDGDAVLHAAGQQEEVLQLQPLALTEDVAFDLLQLLPQLVDELQSPRFGEVLLCVLAQRNLSKGRWNVIIRVHLLQVSAHIASYATEFSTPVLESKY